MIKSFNVRNLPIEKRPTVLMAAVTLTLHEQPTTVHPALTDDVRLLHRLQQRADAYHMPLAAYIDMLVAEDYLAWLRWQSAGGAHNE